MKKSYPSREELKKEFWNELPARSIAFVIAFILLYFLFKVLKIDEQLNIFNTIWGNFIFFFLLFMSQDILFKVLTKIRK